LPGWRKPRPIKRGYTPPTSPSCLDLQHSWDVLDGLIRVKLDAIYGPGYPGLAGLENAILHHRPDCPVSITPLDLSGDLTDFVLNHLNTDPPAGNDDPPPITLAGNDPPSWNDGSWGKYGLVNTVVTTSDPPVSVPEPTSLALLGSGIFGLLMLRRRRSQQ
jgi:hypothetical protein